MKPIRKSLLCLYLNVLTLFTALGPSLTSNAAALADNNISLPKEAVYNLSLGGTQEFNIIDAEGNSAFITITEEIPTKRIDNGTYKVTYTSDGCWRASYRVVISNNSITSVNSPEYAAINGQIRQHKLVRETSKQASYYLLYQINAYSVNTGVRSRISSTELIVSVI